MTATLREGGKAREPRQGVGFCFSAWSNGNGIGKDYNQHW